MIDDREIVRGKVPNYVHIVLEQTQIDAYGIIVVDLSQSTFLEQLGNFLYRSSKQESVIHHDLQILLCRKIDELFCLARITGKGLLDKHMLAVLQCGLGEFVVSVYRGHDGNRIDLSR